MQNRRQYEFNTNVMLMMKSILNLYEGKRVALTPKEMHHMIDEYFNQMERDQNKAMEQDLAVIAYETGDRDSWGSND